ncbi:MAG: alpha/beta fold hydrolase [Pseudomonadota bacterium]
MKLVLLPGMDGTGELFSPFVSELPGTIEATVIAYPLNTFLDYADLTAYVRERLPTDEPYVVLGESFSGPIAIKLAAEQPSGLVGLILCCTFARNPKPLLAPFQGLTGWFSIKKVPLSLTGLTLLGSAASQERKADLQRALDKVDDAVLTGRLKAIARIDVTGELKTIRVPVLSLSGTNDRLVSRASVDHIRRHLPTMQAAALAAPHMVLQTQPKQAVAEIVRFIESLTC